jgi:hypothetical protein
MIHATAARSVVADHGWRSVAADASRRPVGVEVNLARPAVVNSGIETRHGSISQHERWSGVASRGSARGWAWLVRPAFPFTRRVICSAVKG